MHRDATGPDAFAQPTYYKQCNLSASSVIIIPLLLGSCKMLHISVVANLDLERHSQFPLGVYFMMQHDIERHGKLCKYEHCLLK